MKGFLDPRCEILHFAQNDRADDGGLVFIPAKTAGKNPALQSMKPFILFNVDNLWKRLYNTGIFSYEWNFIQGKDLINELLASSGLYRFPAPGGDRQGLRFVPDHFHPDFAGMGARGDCCAGDQQFSPLKPALD